MRRSIYSYLPQLMGVEPQTLEQKVAAEIIATQQYQRKTEKWKLWLSGISTAALVTLTVAAIAGGRK